MMSENCIFCRIAEGKFNTEFLYSDEKVVAFRDVNPQAPFHILIIPRDHYNSVKDVKNADLLGHMFSVGNQVARENDIESFRYVINTGEEAGQTVFHLHLHLLGGRAMSWPPG
jgi:histidine triad (HIT) family protein